MAGREALLHAKTRSNWKAPALAGVASVFMVVWCAMHAHLGFALGLGLAAFFMLLGLFFAVLRVKVTTEHVDVHYGLIGPKIPLASIESVEAVTHDWNSFLRWGITPVGRGEWLYAIAGDEGRAVKIVWRTKSGGRQVHYLGSPDADELAATIESARAPRALARADADDE